MTCVPTEQEIKTKMVYTVVMATAKMKFLLVYDLKIFIQWEGEWKIFRCWVGFSPVPRVSHKGSGERGRVRTWWVHYFFDIFVKKEDTQHIILGDIPAGHCFVLKDLVLIELFQISHNCVTELMLQGKSLLKLV